VIKPEEKELKYKKATLAELEEVLASCELERATLEAELLGFQRIYLEAVGGLIAELDELEAQIAEAIASNHPMDDASAQGATNARKTAEESAKAYSDENKAVLPKGKFMPTEDLKRLFRDVAKKIHPDLASSEDDRAIREDLMKRANEAYGNGDEQKLRSILEEYEALPESIEVGNIGTQLVSVIRKIDLVNQCISEIRREIEFVAKSELAILKKKMDSAKLENRDFLAEMAAYLRQKIKQAKIELKEMQSKVVR
jgi:hypothetical protein